MVSSVPLRKAPLSFASRMNSALVLTGRSRGVSHLTLAKPWALLMTQLRLHSASRILGQAIGTPGGYSMRSRMEPCGTRLAMSSLCVLSMISATMSNSPHRPGGGLDSIALNFLQTSCIAHFCRKLICCKTRLKTSSGSFVIIFSPMTLQASAVVARWRQMGLHASTAVTQYATHALHLAPA